MGVNLINTADGKELINLTNDTVSEATLLSGETAHNAAGDQITGKAAYVNPNLLINPDFSINQRGKAEYSGAGYTVDGWYAESNTSTKKNDDSSVTITSSSSSSGSGFYQRIEPYEELVGETVTLSILAKGQGTIALCVNGWNVDMHFIPLAEEYALYGATFTVSGAYNAIGIYATDGTNASTVTIAKAKLELGSIQTLARQDDEGNWVIIDPPPNPAVELLKCQRYFERVQIPVNNRLTAYMFTDTSSCSYNIEYKPKRTVPTIVKPEYNGRFVEQYNQRVVVLTSFDIESLTTTNVSIHAAFAAALDSKSVGWVDSLGYVDVSAEL